MAEIVNLKRARKAVQRRERADAAEANRIRFGTPTTERAAAKAVVETSARALDGLKREP
jgi:hypothetical protein